jgi:hypothetical protein
VRRLVLFSETKLGSRKSCPFDASSTDLLSWIELPKRPLIDRLLVSSRELTFRTFCMFRLRTMLSS